MLTRKDIEKVLGEVHEQNDNSGSYWNHHNIRLYNTDKLAAKVEKFSDDKLDSMMMQGLEAMDSYRLLEEKGVVLDAYTSNRDSFMQAFGIELTVLEEINKRQNGKFSFQIEQLQKKFLGILKKLPLNSIAKENSIGNVVEDVARQMPRNYSFPVRIGYIGRGDCQLVRPDSLVSLKENANDARAQTALHLKASKAASR